MFYKNEVPEMKIPEDLVHKIEVLKKCKELPKEDLDGKYKKSYDKLRNEIKEIATELVKAQILRKLFLTFPDRKHADNIQEISDDYTKLISKAIYKDCSVERLKAYMEEEYDALLHYGRTNDNVIISEQENNRRIQEKQKQREKEEQKLAS